MKNDRILKIIFIMVIFILGSFINTKIYARIDTSSIEISQGTKGEVVEQGNKILGVIKVVAIFCSVAGAMILGIKYMMGSIEEKSKTKEALILYLIGVILVFGITGIVNMVVKILN